MENIAIKTICNRPIRFTYIDGKPMVHKSDVEYFWSDECRDVERVDFLYALGQEFGWEEICKIILEEMRLRSEDDPD